MTTVRFLEFPREGEALRALRQRVLYPGLPHSKAFYPGDETAQHIGAFDDAGSLVGIASLFPREDGSLQLRGMATAPLARGSGAGRAIVRFAEEHAGQTGTPLWCNARVRAMGFYEKCGWVVEGEEFDVPDIGPHYVMRSPASGR
jgi:GNAT superfamily N-acetyltransferase